MQQKGQQYKRDLVDLVDLVEMWICGFGSGKSSGEPCTPARACAENPPDLDLPSAAPATPRNVPNQQQIATAPTTTTPAASPPLPRTELLLLLRQRRRRRRRRRRLLLRRP
jgi:hypothetical protein